MFFEMTELSLTINIIRYAVLLPPRKILEKRCGAVLIKMRKKLKIMAKIVVRST